MSDILWHLSTAMKNKRNRNGVGRREKTLLKKSYELGRFPGIDVALIIRNRGRYSTFMSMDQESWPPTRAEIVSGDTISLTYANIRYRTGRGLSLRTCPHEILRRSILGLYRTRKSLRLSIWIACRRVQLWDLIHTHI